MAFGGEYDYLYFFSTIAQSMAALFALGGVFAVFRLQLLETYFQKHIEKIREKILLITYYRTDNEIKRIIKDSLKKQHGLADNSSLEIRPNGGGVASGRNVRIADGVQALYEWESLEEQLRVVKNMSYKYMIVVAIIFVWAIINLMICSDYREYKWYKLSVCTILILLSLILTKYTINMIKINLQNNNKYLEDFKKKVSKDTLLAS